MKHFIDLNVCEFVLKNTRLINMYDQKALATLSVNLIIKYTFLK